LKIAFFALNSIFKVGAVKAILPKMIFGHLGEFVKIRLAVICQWVVLKRQWPFLNAIIIYANIIIYATHRPR